MSYRLPSPTGRFINRDRLVRFSFDGHDCTGFQGDTLASALLANDHTILSRSFKYHRPRGVLGMADGDANGLVLADGAGSLPAERLQVRDGLVAHAQNVVGSARYDWLAILDRLGWFLPAGFYYKAFFKPRGAWARWEPVLRRLAGLGPAPSGRVSEKQRVSDKQYLHADVAVIGAGPAGMAAAIRAADAGAKVVLIESQPAVGGGLLFGRYRGRGARWSETLRAMVARRPNIRILVNTLCNGWYDDQWLELLCAGRMYKLRAGAVVAATGSFSQPVVFRNNDLPGIMLDEAALRLIHLYGVAPGRNAVLLTAEDSSYDVALDLLDHGINIAAIVDMRDGGGPPAHVARLEKAGVAFYCGATVWEAVPDRGASIGPWRLAGVQLGAVGDQLPGPIGRTEIACDLMIMSAGRVPSAALVCQTGAKLAFDPHRARFGIDGLPSGAFVAGGLAGKQGLRVTVGDGRDAGAQAARHAGFESRSRGRPFFVPRAMVFRNPIFPHPRGRDFVDYDEDIQVKDIRETVRLGYEHIELAKRFSTTTMGPSQGRHSRLPLALVLSKATGQSVDAVGTTTFRPPLVPESFHLLAGKSFEPVRFTPMHHRHLEAGARMMPAGTWLRPAYYAGPHGAAVSIRDEVTAVRESVGLIDVSTLGGFEIRGPDAAAFMNRIYTFAYLKQAVGRARYVLMTDQTGVIVDDGVACRLREDHFYVTATTGAAAGNFRQLQWWNAQWRMRVDLADVTGAYAAVNIAGPKAREVLAPVVDDIDLSADAFPYMGVREGHVAGIPARLFRVGFVGELGYEIHVPAAFGEALWDILMEAGAAHGMRRFGVEAQRILRLEKGHVIIGQDTDGLTDPMEADMMWAVSKKKPSFIGKRALAIRGKKPLTRQLVGFEITDPAQPQPEESHLVIRDGEITGRVTSVARSPSLDKIIGLAFVAPDQAIPGNPFHIKISGDRMVTAHVVKPPFYDPDNARQDR